MTRPADPASVGVDPWKLGDALETFRSMARRRRFPGGAIALHRRGVLIVNEAVGRAWQGGGDATPETPFCVWSASKPLVAMTIAKLEEQGALDVNAPIASFLPAFGANGKSSITTLDVLTHRSGVIVPELGQAHSDWPDWNKGLAKIFAAKPRYPRGTTVYHPYEFGWILAAVVEAIAKRSFTDVFAETMPYPMRWYVGSAETERVAHTYLLGGKPIKVSGVKYDQEFQRAANTTMLESFIPGGSMVTTASALSAFYATLVDGGFAPGGQRVFTKKTVDTYTAPHASGWDPMNRLWFSFGRGFLVGGVLPSLFGPWNTSGCFGHGGALCSFAFGDHRTGLSGAILTNGNWSMPEFALRFGRLVHGLRAAC